jgi:hypothetical protein
MIDLKFWVRLSKTLAKSGWLVCSICQNSHNYIEGTIKVDFSLAEAIPFSEEAGCVISSRSGICDLLAFSKTNLKIVYPDEHWYGGKLIDWSSVVKMGFNNSTEEYVYKNDGNLIKEIMKNLPE